MKTYGCVQPPLEKEYLLSVAQGMLQFTNAYKCVQMYECTLCKRLIPLWLN